MRRDSGIFCSKLIGEEARAKLITAAQFAALVTAAAFLSGYVHQSLSEVRSVQPFDKMQGVSVQSSLILVAKTSANRLSLSEISAR